MRSIPQLIEQISTRVGTALDEIRFAAVCGLMHGIANAVEALLSEPTSSEDEPPAPVDFCHSCGADPRVSPPSGQEVPIVRGALDAQAKAERSWFETRMELLDLTERTARLRRTIMNNLGQAERARHRASAMKRDAVAMCRQAEVEVFDEMLTIMNELQLGMFDETPPSTVA